MSGIQQTLLGGSPAGYQIERSLRFNSADSAYLSRTNSSSPTNAKIGTLSVWLKRASLATGNSQYIIMSGTGTSNNTHFQLFFQTDNTLSAGQYSETPFTNTTVFRDPSAWYHIVISYDSTQATASNRFKLYVNNQLFTSSTTITQNNEWAILQSGQAIDIGRHTTVARHFDGYMTEFNVIDGQALTPSSFGQSDPNTGVWSPIKYTGTYGTNGFYLNFSDNSNTTSTTLGKDSSGNGNNYTPNLFSVTAGTGNDSLVDTPTSYGTDTGVGGEVRGNYPTLSPIFRNDTSTTWTFSNGNLQYQCSSNPGNMVRCTQGFPVGTGKWYWETTVNNTAVRISTGIVTGTNSTSFSGTSIGATSDSYGCDHLSSAGTRRVNNNSFTLINSSAASNGDVFMLAFDAAEGKLWFGRNGTWYGATTSETSANPATGTQPTFSGISTTTQFFPAVLDHSSLYQGFLNFGQRPFAHTAPSGFKALCTQNLPTPTIGATSTTQANRYMDAKLWAGNGSTQSISSYSFAPDFAWIKSRGDAQGPVLYDTARPVGNYLMSNATDKEESLYSMFTAWNSDGFSLSTTGGNNTNGSTRTYVGWAWKANGTGVSNTSGTITSTVSANTTAGFSIVTYTGNGTTGTVGHGLGVTPSMIIVKSRSVAQRWTVFHTSTSNAYIYLNETFGSDTANANVRFGNNTSVVQPTSTLFTIGSSADVNQGTTTYVAYCFAAVAGYSAFGSYSGNNSSTDGTFVYLGFRPRFIMIKSTSAGTDWVMMDSARNTYNLADTSLYANSSSSESTIGTVNDIDFLSNGFKLRNNTGFVNASQTYIYAAFAEAPFKYSLAQ